MALNLRITIVNPVRKVPRLVNYSMDPTTRILIAEDEKGPRDAIQMVLGLFYKTYVAKDGAEALDILKAKEIDLVTLDLRMPGIQGEALLRDIRGENPDVGIIIITGNANLNSMIKFQQYGVQDHLFKPFDVGDLMTKVRKNIRQKRNSEGINPSIGWVR